MHTAYLFCLIAFVEYIWSGQLSFCTFKRQSKHSRWQYFRKSWVLLLFHLGDTGFEVRALHLLGSCSTTWVIPPDLYAFGYFSDRFLCFLTWLTSDCDPPTYASYTWVYKCVCWGGGLANFLPGLASSCSSNCSPPISASHVAGIIGMSHSIWWKSHLNTFHLLVSSYILWKKQFCCLSCHVYPTASIFYLITAPRTIQLSRLSKFLVS
jgi:hypothetical protein